MLQVLEGSGLRSLLPCLHLVRTVRLNGSQFDDSSVRKLTEVASEVRRTQRSALLHFWHRHCDKNMRILREWAIYAGPRPATRHGSISKHWFCKVVSCRLFLWVAGWGKHYDASHNFCCCVIPLEMLSMFQVRANIRELYIHDLNQDIEQDNLDVIRSMCKLKGIKTNLWLQFFLAFTWWRNIFIDTIEVKNRCFSGCNHSSFYRSIESFHNLFLFVDF